MVWTRQDVATEVGVAVLIQGPDGLATLDWADCEGRWRASLARRFGDGSPVYGETDGGRRLRAWLDGDRDAWDGVALMLGGTDFQARVWGALLQVPFGATTTYGQLAAELGLPPGASRAVGAANGANPVSIAVPCHRVVGGDGALTGYAGGLARKAWLLRWEGVALDAGGRRVRAADEGEQLGLL